MQNNLITYGATFDPLVVNLDCRLKELPHSAWKRITPESLDMKADRFKAIIYGRVKTLQPEEIISFTSSLKCTHEDILNPDYKFKDFRTPEEIAEDLNPVKD